MRSGRVGRPGHNEDRKARDGRPDHNEVRKARDGRPGHNEDRKARVGRPGHIELAYHLLDLPSTANRLDQLYEITGFGPDLPHETVVCSLT